MSSMDFVERFTDDEEIRQDEELIEAVEELIETAAVSVWSGIVQDFHDLISHVQTWLEYFFPILLTYQQDPTHIGQDMSRLALYLALAVLSFVVLAPASSWRRQRPSPNDKVAGETSSMLAAQRQNNHRNSSHHALRSPFSTDSPLSQSSSHDESETASRLYDAAETDEERFEKLWPTTIAYSKYNRLVLPPVCRRVKASEQHQQQQQQQQRGAALAQTSSTAKHQHQDAEEADDGSEDDNPAMRLQTYLRNFLWLIRSLLSFDYAGASNTILLWLQGIRRYRRTNSSPGMVREGDVDEQQEAETEEHKQKQKDTDDEEPSEEMRSGHTSPTRGSLSSVRSNQVKHPSDDDEHIIDETSQFDEASDHVFQTPQRGKTLVSEEGEEKKDAGSSVDLIELPIPPRPPVERSHSGSTYYDPSNIETHDRMNQPESEQVMSKQQRKFDFRPKRISRSTPRAKNLLTLYQRSTDMVAAKEAATPQEDVKPKGEESDRVDAEGKEFNVSIPAVPSETDLSATSPGPGSQRFFFEAANTRGSLKRMSIEFPVPDKNGYILDDDYLPDDRYTPLLVFVNSRSGPQQGHLLITQLRRLLNPIQVWDLADGGPETILESFCVLTRVRILVCGGDGTVSWIISALEQMNLQRKWPPIALLPLGTGNDLARVHGWGGGYNNESLIGILQQIQESYISMLDRWEVTIEDKKKKDVKNFINYLGVGADAQAALQVHYLRESRPEWFFSRIINKAWYGVFGAENIIKASCVNVREGIKLFADGAEIPLPRDSQGIILLNIDSYAGGVPLWSHGVKVETTNPYDNIFRASEAPRRSRSMSEGLDEEDTDTRPMLRRFNSVDSMEDMPQNTALMTEAERFAYVTACDRPSSCQDGLLDVVSIRGAFHLGQIKVGLSNAQRLCQCREVRIVIKEKAAVQIDGEPWRQRPCTIRICRKKEAAVMLHRSTDDGGVETEMSKLLDWAEERQLIDRQVHSILMKEFSRRIESKIRQRRARTKENIMRTLKKAISSGAVSNMQGAQSLSWGQDGIAF